MVIWHELRNGGWPNWIILLLGIGGIACGLVAVVVATTRSPAGRWLGLLTVLVAALVGAAGILGVFHGRALVESLLSSGVVSPDQAERIRHAGYSEAQSCAKFGLALAVLPLLCGVVALLLPPRKHDEPEPGSFQPPGVLAPPPSSARTVLGLGLAAIALALLLALVNVVLVVQDPPGHARFGAATSFAADFRTSRAP